MAEAELAPIDLLEEAHGKRERAKAANRQAILEAAKRVFAQIGYEAATVRDIIRGTELASGTFYNYFKSKEEVFEALADDGARRFKPHLRAAREQSETFEEFIRRAYVAYFSFVVHEHSVGGLHVAERRPHIHSGSPEMAAIYLEVREGIEDAIARGLAPDIDPDYLASACIGAAQELGPEMLRRSPPDIAGAADFAATLILRGLGGMKRSE